MPESTEPQNRSISSDTHLDEQNRERPASSSTHLTPAEAGRLLGRSPARVREMIRFGELTQERVGDRWLIPVRDVERIVNSSPQPRAQKSPMPPKDQKPKPHKEGHEGKFYKSTSLSLESVSTVAATKQTGELAAGIERLDARMKQIDNELRMLRSGLLNDEKRERIEKLRTEKRELGKQLQKLQRELARSEER